MVSAGISKRVTKGNSRGNEADSADLEWQSDNNRLLNHREIVGWKCMDAIHRVIKIFVEVDVWKHTITL